MPGEGRYSGGGRGVLTGKPAPVPQAQRPPSRRHRGPVPQALPAPRLVQVHSVGRLGVVTTGTVWGVRLLGKFQVDSVTGRAVPGERQRQDHGVRFCPGLGLPGCVSIAN